MADAHEGAVEQDAPGEQVADQADGAGDAKAADEAPKADENHEG